VIIDDGSRSPVFRDLSGLQKYAVDLGLTIQPTEPGATSFDLDEIVHWIEAPTGVGITCELFLNSWNLFDDIARSVQESTFVLISKEECALYDKLFWGSNLPAVTPPGEHFNPIWSDQEVEALRRVFEKGMTVLRRTLRDPA